MKWHLFANRGCTCQVATYNPPHFNVLLDCFSFLLSCNIFQNDIFART
uniref:Uncharacterized protein n=1 Tax=Arundo donax TaxID=35708 RepID=A0A0A8ZCB9_ARUDO